MSEPKYVTDYLEQAAARLGGEPFLVCPDKTLSWGEMNTESKKVNSFVGDKLNGRQQKIVGILLPDSWQFVAAYLGVVGSGNIAMPLDVTFKKLEFDFVTAAVKPEFTVVSRETRHLIEGPAVLIEDILQNQNPGSFAEQKLPPEKQIATLFFSSGTTGKPKPIPNTHANQLWDVKAIAGPMGWTERDSLLITLHLAHRHGLVICLLGAVYHGNTVYLEERFNPQRTLDLLQSGKVSLYSSVPAAYTRLVEYKPAAKFDLSSVRLFASSSSALSPQLQKAFKSRFGRDILDRYGTSETGSIAIKGGTSDSSFGELLDGVKIRLEKAGEVALKSPGLFPGYYQNPAATNQNMTRDGWWLTGDIGEMSGEQLVLKGRTKEKISKGGYSIFPQDIEWALLQDRGVEEVKVAGITPAETEIDRDDRVVAFYTGSVSVEKLSDYSKVNLPRSWRPDAFVKMDSLPKTPNGKPQLAELKKLAEQAV